MSIGDAADLGEEWLAEPNVRRAEPCPRHRALAFGFLRSIGTAGNLTTDAQLAAIAVENDATMWSDAVCVSSWFSWGQSRTPGDAFVGVDVGFSARCARVI